MKQKSIDAYVIPSADPHLGENISDHWKIIRWLTGFDGSAGTVAVTDTFAGLWTDSRYYLQAEVELRDSGFILMKQGLLPGSGYIDWLTENNDTWRKIAFDGRLFSISSFRKLKASLEHENLTIDYNCDLITDIWNDRPPLPSSLAFDHPVEFAGKERSRKLSEVREEMQKLNVNYHLLLPVMISCGF
jgi:Xaa-Pro aminopeptidase